jgi:hypothetical protein
VSGEHTAPHPHAEGRPELDRRAAGRRAGGRSGQSGGIPFEVDAHTREAGASVGTIARADAVTESIGPRSDRTNLGQPALTPEGATMATDASDRERQRRELEEIRRKFTEMGARVGSLFEPAPPDDQEEDIRPVRPALAAPEQREQPAPAGQSRLMVAAVAVALLVGTGLGYALPRSSAQRAASAAQPAAGGPASTPTPTVSTLAAQPRTVTSVPPACLEAARKGDLTIHLYTINVRDRRLVEALKAYTLASQACRKEASP